MANGGLHGISSPHSGTRLRTLRLRIVNINNGQLKVLLRLPVSLVSVAQRLGAQLLPPTTSIEALALEAEQHGSAKLEWVNAAHNERLELTLE